MHFDIFLNGSSTSVLLYISAVMLVLSRPERIQYIMDDIKKCQSGYSGICSHISNVFYDLSPLYGGAVLNYCNAP